jgi:hypothetical protein
MRSRRQKRSQMRTRKVRIKNEEIKFLVGGDKKCIFVPLHDGLGNQLYIYAAGLVAKKKLGLPLCLLPGSSQHSDKNYRKLLFTNELAVNTSNTTIQPRKNASTRILTKLKNAYNEWANTNIIANTSKNVILPTTYFQHYAAIEGVVPEMRKNILSSLKKLYPDMAATVDSDTSAFVQVRRKDYEGLGAAMPKEYYQKGLTIICEKNPALKKVYCISNDMAWCKEQKFTLPAGVELVYYDEPDEVKTMYMMALCKAGAVISPSSFGVWGAVFGPHENANSTIIYPKRWILLGNSSKLKLPARWQTID